MVMPLKKSPALLMICFGLADPELALPSGTCGQSEQSKP